MELAHHASVTLRIGKAASGHCETDLLLVHVKDHVVAAHDVRSKHSTVIAVGVNAKAVNHLR